MKKTFNMKKKIEASVLIANYNNQKYIKQCIKSLLTQTYKNFEIIFHDDSSKDKSLKVIKNYKNIKIIKNKKKTKFGSFNQLAAYQKSFKKSKGQIIFFLDSDDYFERNKIKEVLCKFKNNPQLVAVFDLPILKHSNTIKLAKNKKKVIRNFWPYIPPQSCLSIKRTELKRIFRIINFKKFPDIWMDFRIGIYLQHLVKNFYILEKNMTYYRKSDNSVSSNFKFLSKEWWNRRKQAHEYIKYFFKKNKITYKKNFDYFVTSIVSKLI